MDKIMELLSEMTEDELRDEFGTNSIPMVFQQHSLIYICHVLYERFDIQY